MTFIEGDLLSIISVVIKVDQLQRQIRLKCLTGLVIASSGGIKRVPSAKDNAPITIRSLACKSYYYS